METVYLITPFAAWFVAGSLKFIINSIRTKELATSQIGYGGLPSNHTTIVTSIAALITIREGIQHPAFGVALILVFIVILDAGSLRRQIGKHAESINKLYDQQQLKLNEHNPVRERIGHSKIEIIAGIVVGIATAWIVHAVFIMLE